MLQATNKQRENFQKLIDAITQDGRNFYLTSRDGDTSLTIPLENDHYYTIVLDINGRWRLE